jgi:hypothetical protein
MRVLVGGGVTGLRIKFITGYGVCAGVLQGG